MEGHPIDAGFQLRILVDLLADYDPVVFVGVDAHRIVLYNRTDFRNHVQREGVTVQHTSGFAFADAAAVIGENIAAKFLQAKNIGIRLYAVGRSSGGKYDSAAAFLIGNQLASGFGSDFFLGVGQGSVNVEGNDSE